MTRLQEIRTNIAATESAVSKAERELARLDSAVDDKEEEVAELRDQLQDLESELMAELAALATED